MFLRFDFCKTLDLLYFSKRLKNSLLKSNVSDKYNIYFRTFCMEILVEDSIRLCFIDLSNYCNPIYLDKDARFKDVAAFKDIVSSGYSIKKSESAHDQITTLVSALFKMDKLTMFHGDKC